MSFKKAFFHTDGDINLLQITDTHLFSSESTGLLGVNTLDSFRAVLEHIQGDVTAPDFDLVLATGDLSQDHSARSYERFSEEISRLNKQVVWLPGNHDQPEQMNQALMGFNILGAKHLIWQDWQLIMLDTQVERQPYGYLSEQQLENLEIALNEYPDKHTMILMHHQVLPVGSHWLDQHNVKNQDRFHGLIANYKNVRAVVFGHVHQNFEMMHNRVAYIATPSTCIQFLPLSYAFALDHQQPGWRYLRLTSEGKLITRISRLPEKMFLPNPKSKGY